MIAKLRLAQREIKEGKFVPKTFTIQQMKDIRSELNTATHDAFDSYDSVKRKTWADAQSLILD